MASVIGRLIGRLTGSVVQQAAGYGIGTASAAAIAPITQDLANRIWALHPDLPLSPADLANALQQGFIDRARLHSESAMSGVSSDRADILFELAGLPPGTQELGAMLLRGIINEETYRRAVAEGHTKTKYTDDLLKLLEFVLPPDAVAQMVVQNIVPHDAGAAMAAKYGVAADDFAHMVEVRGRPPGPAEAGEMLHRGIIDDATFAQIVAESDIKTKYTDALKQIQFRILSPAQAAQMVVQNILSEADGIKIAEANGLSAEDFKNDVLVRGRPISPTEALTLARRGLLDKATFAQVIAESDVKTKYTDALWNLLPAVPSLYEIRQMVSAGALPDEKAIEYVLDHGYDEQTAKGIVQTAHNSKTAADKSLTKADVLTLYTDNAINRTDAKGMLTALGYDDSEAEFLIVIAEFRRVVKFQDAAIRRVHTAYVNHRIDVEGATTALDALGVPTKQREDLLSLWNDEKAANVKILTPAEIAKAAAEKAIGIPEALQKLQLNGYGERDALIYLYIHKVDVKVPPQ